MSTLNILPGHRMITFRTFLLTVLLSISFIVITGLVKGFYYYSQLNKTESSLDANYNNSQKIINGEPLQLNTVRGHVTVLK
jgi:hypothetical protein